MTTEKTKAILLSKTEINEKDLLLKYLTPALGLVNVREYNAQKKGSRSFPLFSDGVIDIKKSVNATTYILNEATITNYRNTSNNIEMFLLYSKFAQIATSYAKYIQNKIYDIVLFALNNVDVNNRKKVFILFCNAIFTEIKGIQNYNICPECESVINENDNCGYNTSSTNFSCNNCADIKDALLPGMRKYLEAISTLPIDKAISLQISDSAIEKVYRYMLFHLNSQKIIYIDKI